MSKNLAFATMQGGAVDEIRAILPEFQVHVLPVEELPPSEIQSCATILSQKAQLETGYPALAIVTDFCFEAIGPALNLAGLGQLRRLGPAEFCQRMSGTQRTHPREGASPHDASHPQKG